MPSHLDRRQFLRSSAAVAVGLGAAGLSRTAWAENAPGSTLPPAPGVGDGRARDPVLDLPPVPGMLGDRRANEMWYQLDLKTLYDPVPGIFDAYLAINEYAAAEGGVDAGPLVVWLRTYRAAGYPETFRDWAAPIKEPLALISTVLLENFDAFYARRSPNLTGAFGDFAQGVLYDPRHIDAIHSMDGDPPIGYPVWHAYTRAMMVLGLSTEHWKEILPLIAFACELQLKAKPDQTNVNPPQPPSVVRRAAATTLHLSTAKLDAYYLTFPYPPGLSSATATVVPAHLRRGTLR
jgi:hypothetical protein